MKFILSFVKVFMPLANFAFYTQLSTKMVLSQMKPFACQALVLLQGQICVMNVQHLGDVVSDILHRHRKRLLLRDFFYKIQIVKFFKLLQV